LPVAARNRHSTREQIGARDGHRKPQQEFTDAAPGPSGAFELFFHIHTVILPGLANIASTRCIILRSLDP